jgi:pimeloyl-ACP methyl ester carboxylesterase
MTRKRETNRGGKMGKKVSLSLAFFMTFLLSLTLFMPGLAAAAAPADRYTARTADGVELAMKRYRPDEKAGFRRKGQPVILMPGMLCNINYFDVWTPPGKSYAPQLPPLPDWARRDPYIKKDPMRYYSLAHYLWLQGYDVWLANYRGQGREPYMSGGAEKPYTPSDCGIYDLPAIVEKVYEVTGKHPVWIGHSMGAAMAYIYLEGATYAGGDRTKIVLDPALAAERNGGRGRQSLKGFVDLDGPIEAAGNPANNNSDDGSSWPAYIDLRYPLESFGDFLGSAQYFSSLILWCFYQALGCPDLGFLNALLICEPNDVQQDVLKYIVTYGVDGISGGVFATLLGNMQGNPDVSPEVANFYRNNLYRITLPAMVVADGTFDLTDPEDIRQAYVCKTRNRADVFMKLAGTAHMDLVFGLKAAESLFPEINNWIKKLPR